MDDYKFIPKLDDKNHTIMKFGSDYSKIDKNHPIYKFIWMTRATQLWMLKNLVQITQKVDDMNHPIIELS